MQAHFSRDAENSVLLPKSLKQLDETFPSKITQQTCLTEKQRTIQLYSGNALKIGRPLDCSMIYLAGLSGSGKSSTINSLFEDNSLCPTSEAHSNTKNVFLIEKTICATNENPAVRGRLVLVDNPGFLDSNNADLENLAILKQFRNDSEELADRRGAVPKNREKVRPSVYPNIVLFVVNGNDERMGGTTSPFAKSLKIFEAALDLIDYEWNNVIVVLTHAVGMASKKEKFEEKLKLRTKIIQEQFEEILNLKNVLVVPVENSPEDYELKKDNDFYELPNHQISHLNLFEAMITQTEANGDSLGGLLLSRYFGPCVEKREKAVVRKFVPNPDANFIRLTTQELENLNLFALSRDEAMEVPVFAFGNLGHGFCPVTESVKPAIPFESFGSLRKINLRGRHFLIPEAVKEKIEAQSKCERLTFLKRNDFQSYLKKKYNIDASMELLFQGNHEGKWLEAKHSTNEFSSMLFLQEIQLAKFSLKNADSIARNQLFERDLKTLPNKYKKDVHQAFFSKWGTHFVYEEAVGGYMQLNCSVKSERINITRLRQIEVGVRAIFNSLCKGSANGNYSDKLTELRQNGVCNDVLKICGGKPPALPSLDTPNPDEIRIWTESICECPTMLENSIKVSPYYNMLPPGDQQNALTTATQKYLEGKMNATKGSTLRSVNAEIALLKVSLSTYYRRYALAIFIPNALAAATMSITTLLLPTTSLVATVAAAVAVSAAATVGGTMLWDLANQKRLKKN